MEKDILLTDKSAGFMFQVLPSPKGFPGLYILAVDTKVDEYPPHRIFIFTEDQVWLEATNAGAEQVESELSFALTMVTAFHLADIMEEGPLKNRLNEILHITPVAGNC